MFTAMVIFLSVLALVVLVAGPLVVGRLVAPGLTLAFFRRFGSLLAGLLDRIRPNLDLELLVKAINRRFRRAYETTPFQDRILFLPFCLCPRSCPAEIRPEVGLDCQGGCPNCLVGEVRAEALSLGYARVFVVPSSRLLPGRGLLPSDQFIKAKLQELAPRAALGVVCSWHLRNRILPKHTLDRKGYPAGGAGKVHTVLQGVLLDGRNCRAAKVDWDRLRSRLRLIAA